MQITTNTHSTEGQEKQREKEIKKKAKYRDEAANWRSRNTQNSRPSRKQQNMSKQEGEHEKQATTLW